MLVEHHNERRANSIAPGVPWEELPEDDRECARIDARAALAIAGVDYRKGR
jgi:hypothetical protein